ncbi:MAG: Cysteine desulfurase [Candidatus Nomurabacteria bacterium GW2011_GWE1_32_28]|uniref:Cysteine desulfurase n=1 Tax=Candidatus Nomurabacteria bacterium GW2011_GWF1_31_48 TaxID=1618767 RepID=A0A0F9YW30_9BACT|nr:MAG: Cysteine desulfurase [Candidatus Nomurabacteria bacterium GW2011_GWF2_30_133]KKP28903.1 MAG: Cysteine desulfurase [Candidatus Nomurabacteria bacterium GW2011_GWE2_31_40]KKP30641.1 MAG: Cysteine desulfurase [Candidatus Nomurabacteria bacterium GW2011_GWF1_31_48]KKP35159.1 MAG: Cysteine desulfurase [Candidatus Nomurabacteria bacterium GW2011_GWE1_32_28]HAS80469.1 cysteine desulfurase NifS [Candidatus Nomurabacteria bacterium]
MVKSNQKLKKIYLDYAASISANPSSLHILGIEAKLKLQNARIEVASFLKARPQEIIFTSGGTESNNLAIQGVINKFFELDFKFIPHIITTNIEHPSVLETFKILKKRKLVEVSFVSVEKSGIVDPKKIKKEIKNNTILISVMYANNEIGTIQPIKEIAKEIRYYKKYKKNLSIFPLFHTDAVQAVNYLDLNVEKLGVDLLSLSGTKIEDAGRVGVLYKKNSVKISAIFGGGDQEMGLRPGTENLKEILKFSNALKFLQKNKDKENERLSKLRDYFIKKLLKSFSNIILNGDLEERLPNNINITFLKIPSDLLVIELSAKGIMVSSKSACSSSQKGGSYVIESINSELDKEIGGVRFSLGKKTNKADIDYTIKVLFKILEKLKKWYK